MECSATDCTKLFCEDKNGFTAFRYLNEGDLYRPPEIIAIPITTKIPNTIAVFLIAFFSDVLLLTIAAINKNAGTDY